MKILQTDLPQIESYLLGDTQGGDRVLFEARLILEPDLKTGTHWQKETYAYVNQYGRQKLREEIDLVEKTIFTAEKHKTFRQKILRLFTK